MKHFTIDTENSITVHPSKKAARETGAGVFASEVELADLIGPDNKRLVEIWNSLAGVMPVTKFANRKVATERIWKAIQGLGGPAKPMRKSTAKRRNAIAASSRKLRPVQPKAARKVARKVVEAAPKPKPKKTAPKSKVKNAVETLKIVNETPTTPVQVAAEPAPATE